MSVIVRGIPEILILTLLRQNFEIFSVEAIANGSHHFIDDVTGRCLAVVREDEDCVVAGHARSVEEDALTLAHQVVVGVLPQQARLG